MGEEFNNLIKAFAKEYGVDVSIVTQIFEQSVKFAASRYYPQNFAQSLKYVKDMGEIVDNNNNVVDIKKKFGLGGIKLLKDYFLNEIKKIYIEKEVENLQKADSKLVIGKIVGKDNKKVFLTYKSLEFILPREEQVIGEEYRIGDLYKVVVVRIEKVKGNYEIIVSRRDEKLLLELLRLEIPELKDNKINIVSAIREPGYRSKVVVKANIRDINVISCCMGLRNARISNVSKELNGERIDIIEFKENVKEFIASLLKPANVKSVQLLNNEKIALVEVPEGEIGICLGKNGQNVRLASMLSGWYIEIKKHG